jgi:hypothetical protein
MLKAGLGEWWRMNECMVVLCELLLKIINQKEWHNAAKPFKFSSSEKNQWQQKNWIKIRNRKLINKSLNALKEDPEWFLYHSLF